MEAPNEEKLVLIKSPNEAIELLLGSPAGKKRDRALLNPNSLLWIYLTPGRGRKFKQIPAIEALAEKCQQLTVTEDDSEERDEQIFNTLQFLAMVSEQFDPAFAKKSYRQALADFVHLNFKTPTNDLNKMEDHILVLLNNLNAQLPAEDRFPTFFKFKDEKMSLWERLKNDISEHFNEDKATFDQIAPHLFVGKKPNAHNVDKILKEINPELVISLIEAKEMTHHYKARRTCSQHFWVTHRVRNIAIGVPDFGKPHRGNPDFPKEMLEALFTDFYYGCVLAAEAMRKGKNVLTHCKAGKGRSVTFDLILLRLIKMGILEAPLDPKTPLETRDILLNYMAKIRTHIDQDEDTIRAANDCVEFIVTNLEMLKKTAPVLGNDNNVQTTHSAPVLRRTASQGGF